MIIVNVHVHVLSYIVIKKALMCSSWPLPYTLRQCYFPRAPYLSISYSTHSTSRLSCWLTTKVLPVCQRFIFPDCL